jgi:hypothetical protein
MPEPGPRRYAPVCYGHIGGVLGERLCTALLEKRWLVRKSGDPALTAAGRAGLGRLGVPVERLEHSPRKPANFCVERHAGRLYPHIGSHLSSLLAEAFVARGWLVVSGRDFAVTPAGRRGFQRVGVTLD